MARRALILREGAAPVRDRLLATLFVAAALHGIIILGLTFGGHGGGHAAPGLEVLLVSDQLPTARRNDHATYLAQRTQRGSGNTDRTVAPRNGASSPPIPAHAGVADGTALDTTRPGSGPRQRVLTTHARQPDILYVSSSGTQADGTAKPVLLAAQLTPHPGPADAPGPVQLRGPHRDDPWVAPDTRKSVLAPYLTAWRRKVERIGTLHFPSAARHASTTANPVVEVEIDSSGKLVHADIRRSSGDAALDHAALRILKLASPFAPFPADLAHDYRLLRFAYEWRFVGGRAGTGRLTTAP